MQKIIRCCTGDTTDGNVGLAILRIFAGAAMMTHGVPKLLGGPELWGKVGSVMSAIGVPGPAVVWGFLAAAAEGFGALALALGFLTRASAALVAFTMAVAAFVAHRADPFSKRELALLYLAVMLMFMLKGAGKYSVDRAAGLAR